MNGILLVNKPAGVTSRDVVNKVSNLLGTKKVGHTGTLDPLATGVLVLCIGSATKLVEILTSTTKEYIAEMILGIKTDTYDITGNILGDNKIIKSEEEIRNVLMSMQGTYEQEVPIYSAVKIDGKKLYEYARENKSIELPKRMVTISDIKLLNYGQDEEYTKFSFQCKVSKGTYIRSLVRDIGYSLGTVATMEELKRTSLGKFKLENSYTIDDIKNNNYKILDIKEVLDLPKIKVDSTLEKKIRNGQVLKKFFNDNMAIITNAKDEVLAIYQVKDEFYVKPYRMFI